MRLFLLLVVLPLAACSGDAGDSTPDEELAWPTTCDAVEAAGLCYAWDGEQTADHEAFQEQCEGPYEGAYSDGACPGEAIARCDTDQGFDLLLAYQYYAPTWDLQGAQTHCEGLASCQFSCTFEAL